MEMIEETFAQLVAVMELSVAGSVESSITEESMTATQVTLTWNRTDPREYHEFEAELDGVVYRAYRHRTPYGWSWFEITENGKPSLINSGRQTELPRRIWR